MKDTHIQLFKSINLLSIVIAIVLWSFFYIEFFQGGYHHNKEVCLFLFPGVLAFPLFVIFALFILLKAHSSIGVLTFALFLSMMSQNVALQGFDRLNTENTPLFVFLTTLSFALTGTLFMKSLQAFPRQLTTADCKLIFPKNKIVSGYLSWSLKGYTWWLFPLVFIVSGFLTNQTHWADGISIILNLLILVTGILALFINYKRSTASEQNKILWLLWGLISYLMFFIVASIIHTFNPGTAVIINFVIKCLSVSALMISMVMSIFFFNTFDTGIIVRKTLVHGLVFIAFVLVYNTVEHYFLHWLSHRLHLSDVLVSSFLSGIFVLVFSPVHHKLMHYMEGKLKRHAQ